jgi:hypothetical protein
MRLTPKERINMLRDLGITKRNMERSIKDQFASYSRYCPHKTCLGKCRITNTENHIERELSLYFLCSMTYCPYMKETYPALETQSPL